jgi:hypothetical protein
VIDILTEHDPYTVDVNHTKFADPIRLVRRLRGNSSAPTDYFLEVGVDILDPLEEVTPFGLPTSRTK